MLDLPFSSLDAEVMGVLHFAIGKQACTASKQAMHSIGQDIGVSAGLARGILFIIWRFAWVIVCSGWEWGVVEH